MSPLLFGIPVIQEDQEWYLHSLIENHEDEQLLAILDNDYQLVKKRDMVLSAYPLSRFT